MVEFYIDTIIINGKLRDQDWELLNITIVEKTSDTDYKIHMMNRPARLNVVNPNDDNAVNVITFGKEWKAGDPV